MIKVTFDSEEVRIHLRENFSGQRLAEGIMRISSLDGVRGLAIAMVVLTHYQFFDAGWAGVDLFFVLSGYLITKILLRTKCDSDYWTTFYFKRAIRILPPLIPVLVIGCLFSGKIGLFAALGYIFFLGNLVEGTLIAHSRILAVTWSLSVEEHFYLVWPMAALYLTRKTLASLLCIVLVTEPILRFILSPFIQWKAIYFLTPFRLDGLAAGALLALIVSSPRLRPIFQRLGLGISLAAFGVYVLLRIHIGHAYAHTSGNALFNASGYSLVTLSAFGLIAHLLLHQNGMLSALFSWRPLVSLGRVSYGLYLYHKLVLTIIQYKLHLPEDMTRHDCYRVAPLGIGIAVALSYLSFYLYESPLMRWLTEKREAHSTDRALAA